MPKRPREDVDDLSRPAKRSRFSSFDKISPLSDELLLRIFSNLPISTLALCQRISHRFYDIAGDSQLWKSAYYTRFVRPRASRIPGIRDHGSTAGSLQYSSKVSRWLDDHELVKSGSQTNWKRQYKLRHNWSRGSCDVREIQVAERPCAPPLLVRLHQGIVFTVDLTCGLRAWTVKGNHKLLAIVALRRGTPDGPGNIAPTSMGVDVQDSNPDLVNVAIGFEDGQFSIYALKKSAGKFIHRFSHAPSSAGMISAIAFAAPYLLAMTEGQLLSLYRFSLDSAQQPELRMEAPHLLCSLQSHTVWPPLSLSLRPSSQNILASIAYALPTYPSGWSVGLQELRLTLDGEIKESRIASAVEQGFQSLSMSSAAASFSSTLTDQMPSKPTSLSYSHPYLLASRPDNTLTLYLVTSTMDSLSIGSGTRLWGHTSSVSSAHVGGRGKAVSVSSRGDDLRIWELEGGTASASMRRRLATGEMSIRIRPDTANGIAISGETPLRGQTYARQFELRHLVGCGAEDAYMSRGWVGFDDEKVVVLQDRSHEGQALVVYDFT
ncbi:hypothetical protein L228DRAFT_284656 [Xylona heveae TC161]|uniref:F-box domain-containing protein n=1 Tax=Xylona heveae (strain CBS 132557 / TC161) TaxID=1328760 RepID=A0A165F8T0_XYLHT|nr:hypothetical protein L228DRAFT_284656 [Xylona heveae TC161]KZF20712.1 hypothetical protein L228DRAFT_284656 [Xylona heveae TC161]